MSFWQTSKAVCTLVGVQHKLRHGMQGRQRCWNVKYRENCDPNTPRSGLERYDGARCCVAMEGGGMSPHSQGQEVWS